MKLESRKLLKKNLVLILILLVIVSCEKDNVEIENQTQLTQTYQPKFQTQQLNFNDLPHKTQIKVHLQQIKQNTLSAEFSYVSNSDDADTGSSGYNPLAGLQLIQSQAEYTTYDGGHTYTFATYRDTDNGLIENIVLESQSDGNYNEYLVQYQLDANEYEDLQASNPVSFDLADRTTLLPLENGSFNAIVSNSSDLSICYELVMVVEQCGSGQHHANNMDQWGNCVHAQPPVYYFTWQATICGETGGGNSGVYDGGNPNNGTNPGDFSGGGNGSIPDPNNPGGLGNPNNGNNNSGIQDAVSEIKGASKPLEIMDANAVLENCLGSSSTAFLSSQNLSIAKRNQLANFINTNGCHYVITDIINLLNQNSDLTFEEALLLEDFVVIESDTSTKVEPSEELECFDLTQGAKLTVYIQQPRENSDAVVGPNQVGHAFIGIEQGSIVRQIGYYPETGANEGLVAVGVDYNAEIRTNYNYLYHVSISQDISSTQLTNIVNYSVDFPPTYDVNDYACTDFAIAIGNLGGMGLPSTTVNYATFSGRSPGKLGQEIRAMNSTSTTTITTNKTNSPFRQGECSN